MYTISKRFRFAASHQLEHLGSRHKCSRLHGHNYDVVLTLASDELDGNGFVKDYGCLAHFRTFLDEEVEHRHLNDVCSFYTTAENLARWFYDVAHEMWPQVLSLTVCETPDTTATYSPSSVVSAKRGGTDGDHARR